MKPVESHTHNYKQSVIKILSVDDDRTIRALLLEIFQGKYFHTHVETANKFLHTISTLKPDILLIDITLPDGNGINLCRRIRSGYTNYSPYIIVMTGHNESDIISSAYNSGANDFIRKPFDLFEIEAKIKLVSENILAKRHLDHLYSEVKSFNEKFVQLTQIINKNINEMSKKEIISTIEEVIHILEADYCEVILAEEPSNHSYSIKRNSFINYISYEKLIKTYPKIMQLKKDHHRLKIRHNGRLLHIYLYRLMFNKMKTGFVILQTVEALPRESTDMLKLYLDFINMKGVDINIQNMLKVEIEKERKEIARVRTIQVSLLPDFKDIPEFDIASTFIPMEEISGDFYDGFYGDKDNYYFVVCDVCGHGMASSFVGSSIRSMIRTLSPELKVPANIIEVLNGLLTQSVRDISYFATLFFWRINFVECTMTYVCAGHPSSLFYNKKEDRIEELEPTGPIVGLFDKCEFQEVTIPFNEDDVLFVYTDGLIEASEPGSDLQYGINRLKKTFEDHLDQETTLNMIHGVLGDVYIHTDYNPNDDDITIICMKRKDLCSEC